MQRSALLFSILTVIGFGTHLSVVQAKPLPFRGTTPMKVVTPKPPPSYVGGATKSVHFNRQSVGGASGVNPALRARAYRALDSNPAKPYGNKGPVMLPKAGADGKALSYKEVRLKNGPHDRAYSNGRVVVGVGKDGARTGPAYVSRHYGDPAKMSSSVPGKVVRIQ